MPITRDEQYGAGPAVAVGWRQGDKFPANCAADKEKRSKSSQVRSGQVKPRLTRTETERSITSVREGLD